MDSTEGENTMLKKILVAFDGSEQSLYAFSCALDLAINCSSSAPEISVVAVVQLPELVETPFRLLLSLS